jgi:Trypsin-like peptidase domain/Effector-associated domain 9
MSYFQTFKLSIARIFTVDGSVIGAGFLVSDRHLLTCAHVVADALGIDSNISEMPTKTIELDFPLLSRGQKVTAKVVFWKPINSGKMGEDIAVLEIDPLTLPKGLQAARLVTGDEMWGHPFRIFGFPQDRDDGIWANGILKESQASGWLQMENITAQGVRIEHGFSGSPVWDETLDGVVGIAVTADSDPDGLQDAYLIPATILGQAWTELCIEKETRYLDSTISISQKRRVNAVESRLNALMEDFEAAHNQLNFMNSEVERTRQKRQIQSLSREIDQAEEDLQQLIKNRS